jgi:hypothetical protein
MRRKLVAGNADDHFLVPLAVGFIRRNQDILPLAGFHPYHGFIKTSNHLTAAQGEF